MAGDQDDNVLGIWSFARDHFLPALQKTSWNFMRSRFLEIYKGGVFCLQRCSGCSSLQTISAVRGGRVGVEGPHGLGRGQQEEYGGDGPGDGDLDQSGSDNFSSVQEN